MGVDYLDLVFQLEREHGVFVTEEAVAAGTPVFEEVGEERWLRGRQKDIRVGMLYEVMAAHCVEVCGSCYARDRRVRWGTPVKKGGEGTGEWCCAKCGRVLAGPAPGLGWEAFREVLGRVVGMEGKRIEREQWLVRDLGFC